MFVEEESVLYTRTCTLDLLWIEADRRDDFENRVCACDQESKYDGLVEEYKGESCFFFFSFYE